MLHSQKDKFSIPAEISYINNAYMAPLMQSVEAAGAEGIGTKARPWEVSAMGFFDPVEEVKKLFAKLINCDEPQRIAVMPSVSYGIANVAQNIDAKAHQNIVLIDEQFPSNFYSWKRLQDRTGVELRVVAPPENSDRRAAAWNQSILEAIDEHTVAVTMGSVHWTDGTYFDLKTIRQKTETVNALLIIDGTQSVGAYPFDIQEVKADALICSAYKWLLGPYSFTLGFFGKKFDQGIPIEESWFNRLDSHHFEKLVNYQPLYRPQANRFSVGEPCNFITVPMVKTALQQVLDWGVGNIQAYCKNLTESPIQELLDLGCQIEEEAFRCYHLMGVRLPTDIQLDTLRENLVKQKVFVSQRGNAIRIAPHLYCDEGDFEKLLACFKAAKSQRVF